MPLDVLAASLGALNVSSVIGEPLNATIEILAATPDELASLKVSVAVDDVYLVQSSESSANQNSIKTALVLEDGKDVIRLSTSQSVSEPFLDMLIVLEWSNGRIQREYTALLEPPNYQANKTTVEAPKAQSVDNAPIKPLASNNTATSTVTASPSLVQEHLTKKGDTLYQVARKMQPAGVSLDRVLVALFEANPDAFVKNNMHRLRVGKILQAPSAQALIATSRAHAAKEIRLQTADWNEYRHQLATAVAKKTAEESTKDGQSSAGKIKSAAEVQSKPQSEISQDVIKLSSADEKNINLDPQAKISALQEEITSTEKGLKEAKDRAAMLEKQIADMQKLLVLKNSALVDAQQAFSEKKGLTTSDIKPVKDQPSLMASVRNQFDGLNQRTVAGIVVLLLVLPGAWLLLRNKPSKKIAGFERSVMTFSNRNRNATFDTTATATEGTSGQAVFSRSAEVMDQQQANLIEKSELIAANDGLGLSPDTEDNTRPLDISDFSDSPLAAEADLEFSSSESVDERVDLVAGVDDTFSDAPMALSAEEKMELSGLNVDSVDTAAPEAQGAKAVDISGISLDMSNEISFATELDENMPSIAAVVEPEFEEMEAKLELVAAYIDMEDRNGAKALLEEVLKEGNLEQRKRADEILASLD